MILNRMPYTLHHLLGGKGLVMNTKTGKHFEKNPIPIKKAEAQLRLLRGIEHGMVPKKKAQPY